MSVISLINTASYVVWAMVSNDRINSMTGPEDIIAAYMEVVALNYTPLPAFNIRLIRSLIYAAVTALSA